MNMEGLRLRKAVPWTAAAWLDCLGRRLSKYFPGRQAVEMLTDCADHFSLGLERGESEAALAAGLGTPEAAVDALVRENWPVRTGRWQYVWWGLLAVSVWLYWGILRSYYAGGFGEYNSRLVVLPALLLGPLSLFQCLHGKARAEIEGAYPYRKPSVILYVLPALTAIGGEAFFQYWITSYQSLHIWTASGFYSLSPQAELIVLTFELLWWVPKLVLLWSLWRGVTVSIRYLPCAVQAAGVMMCLVCMSNAVRNNLYTDAGRAAGQREALFYFWVYLAGLAVTIAYAVYIRRCMKRGAAWTRS